MSFIVQLINLGYKLQCSLYGSIIEHYLYKYTTTSSPKYKTLFKN